MQICSHAERRSYRIILVVRSFIHQLNEITYCALGVDQVQPVHHPWDDRDTRGGRER